jgi:GTPase
MAIQGNAGADVQIEVPLGISVTTNTGEPLGDINTPADKVLVAKGGPGGGPKYQFRGQMGEKALIRLDLKILADVGLVGFPNAGKSTLLSVLSEAHPRIASFPCKIFHLFR